MKKTIVLFSFFLITCTYAQEKEKPFFKNINPDPLGNPWIIGGYSGIEDSVLKNMQELELPDTRSGLPSRIDNSQQAYFRPVFVQKGGSCGQASGISYTFTYEINFLRKLSSDTGINQYPSHHTWNFLNEGVGKGSNYTDGWEIARENGIPHVEDWGGLTGDEKKWLSGYQAYYNAMFNRVEDYYYIDVSTPCGLNTLKRWLHDHGNASAAGGLANFSAGAEKAVTRKLPYGTHEERKFMILKWSDPVDHAMTIVGYDDSIRYDFNNDGTYSNDKDLNNDGITDMKDWEIGGLIMVNTWGTDWCDSGRAYVPYRQLAMEVGDGGIGYKKVFVVRVKKEHTPHMIMKTSISHEMRNKLIIEAGVAYQLEDTLPVHSVSFNSFYKKGGGFPMQGINDDPIEIALDISPLLDKSPEEPVRYFLIVSEQDKDNQAVGKIHYLSVVDYRKSPVQEWVSPQSDSIKNHGKTILSVFPAFGGMPPRNLSLIYNKDSVYLNWDEPLGGESPLNYHIYKNGVFLDESTGQNYNFKQILPNGTSFKVRALYATGASAPSNVVYINSAAVFPVAASGKCLQFEGINNYVYCGDSIKLHNRSFSIDFWAKRSAVNSKNEFVIGHGKWGKGSQGLHIGFRNNKLMCGFYGDDIHTTQTYRDTDWHHWTISYDTASMEQKIYRDGVLENTRKADSNYMGIGKFYIGCVNAVTYQYYGQIDEVRVWAKVLEEAEIAQGMYYKNMHPQDSSLLASWNFDEAFGDTLYDQSGNGHHGILKNFDPMLRKKSLAWQRYQMKDIKVTFRFQAASDPLQRPLHVQVLSSPNHGILHFDSLDMYFTYTATDTLYFEDSFSYRAETEGYYDDYQIYIKAPLFLNIPSEPDHIQNITVFPNPFSDRIHIAIEKDLEQPLFIQLRDIRGRVLMSDQFRGKEYTFESAHLNQGIYLLILKSNTSVIYKKIIRSGI
jgi:hypothetical protein